MGQGVGENLGRFGRIDASDRARVAQPFSPLMMSFILHFDGHITEFYVDSRGLKFFLVRYLFFIFSGDLRKKVKNDETHKWPDDQNKKRGYKFFFLKN